MWVNESDFFLRIIAAGLAALFWLVAGYAVFGSQDYRGALAVSLVAAANTAIAVGAHQRLKAKRADEASRPKEKPQARDWMGNPIEHRASKDENA